MFHVVAGVPFVCSLDRVLCFCCSAYALSSLACVPVSHSPGSLGCVVTLSNSLTIVYSGDCTPSQQLINAAGKHPHVLIHEVARAHCLISPVLHHAPFCAILFIVPRAYALFWGL